MRFFFTTLGCRLNEAEIGSWQRALRTAGHDLAPTIGEADVGVVNTCAVTAEAARKSRKLVARLHRKNPAARLVVTGCYAALQPDAAAELAGVDLVVPNRDKDALVSRMTSHLALPTRPRAATAPEASPFRSHRTRAFVKVQDGCRNRCTFCIVTVARGEERSRSIAELIGEVRDLLAEGVLEIVLTGVHLGGYGSDLDVTLTDLVTAILGETGVTRLRLSSLEPWDLPKGFGALWRDRRLMPHLHLPLQSGSDPVLRRMARRCPTGRFRALVDELRAEVPKLSITTDWIVGFPGETPSDHQNSLAFIDSLDFADVHVFPYSPRAGTRAASFSDPCPPDDRRARLDDALRLTAVLRERALARADETVDQVLWEGEGPLTADGQRRFSGYTENYLPVETVSCENLRNRILPTRLRHFAGQRTLVGSRHVFFP